MASRQPKAAPASPATPPQVAPPLLSPPTHDAAGHPAAWWHDPLLLLAATLTVGWAALSLTWPLAGDAGVFAWIGDTVIRGGAPYRDAWDPKGPGAWLPALLMQLITGRTDWGIHAFDVAMLVAALGAIRAIARGANTTGGGRIAIALYALWYANLDFDRSAQPDGFVASWLIVACALALRGRGLAAAAAGALVALAASAKPFYAGFMVCVWMMLAFRPSLTRTQRTGFVTASIGGALVTCAAIVVLLQRTGGWDAYLDVIRWSRDVYAGLDAPWLRRIPALIIAFVVVPWGVVAPLAIFGLIPPPGSRRLIVGAVVIGFLGALACVVVQNRYWTYQWLPVLPFLALLTDFGFTHLHAEHAGPVAARFRRVAVAVVVGVAALAPTQLLVRWTKSLGSPERAARYERNEFQQFARLPGTLRSIVDSIARLDANARVLVWAQQQGAQFTAGLRPPNRFAVIRPLYDGTGTASRDAYRAEFIADLRQRPPQWWLLPSRQFLARADWRFLRDARIEDFPAADSLLRQHYRQVATTEDWEIHERIERRGSDRADDVPTHERQQVVQHER